MSYHSPEIVKAIASASQVLTARKDEVNRLNVFPVPDGDTGTNMSLTIETVVENLSKLSPGATSAQIRRAITQGALMGARGNSGVITSQILRGFCEGLAMRPRSIPSRLTSPSLAPKRSPSRRSARRSRARSLRCCVTVPVRPTRRRSPA